MPILASDALLCENKKNPVKNVTLSGNSPERRVLDLEPEAMRGPGSILTGGNIFHWILWFSRSKAFAANIGIIGIIVHFEKTLLIDKE